MAEPLQVARRTFILIDATQESQAPFFAQNPAFQTWLKSYNNIPEALQCITQIPLALSIQVYVARDNILDDGLPSPINSQIRNLLDTLCDIESVRHITILCPTISTDLEEQIRSNMSNPRTLKDVVSIINLHSHMCKEGIQYFQEEQSYCIASPEMNLLPNLQRNMDVLMACWMKAMSDQKKVIDALQEAHSNKPGDEPL